MSKIDDVVYEIVKQNLVHDLVFSENFEEALQQAIDDTRIDLDYCFERVKNTILEERRQELRDEEDEEESEQEIVDREITEKSHDASFLPTPTPFFHFTARDDDEHLKDEI